MSDKNGVKRVCNIAVKHLFGTYSDLYGLCRGSTEPKGFFDLGLPLFSFRTQL